MTLETTTTKKAEFVSQLREQADRCTTNTEKLSVLASYFLESIYYEHASLALGAMIQGFMETNEDVDLWVGTIVNKWMDVGYDDYETVIALTAEYAKEWLDDEINVVTILLGRFAVLNAGK